MLCRICEFYELLQVCDGEQGLRDEGQPGIKELGFDHRSAKEPETPPLERALRIAPVRKEPPAPREQGPRHRWYEQFVCLHRWYEQFSARV